MIDLPAQLVSGAFDELLRQGTVLLTEQTFPDGSSKRKFLIVMNRDAGLPQLRYFVSTSKIDFFKRNPRFAADVVWVCPGTLPIWERDTVIDCRTLYVIDRDELIKRYARNELEFKPELPPSLLQQVLHVVERSRFLSPNQKRLVLPKK